jgi:hypothetical protein
VLDDGRVILDAAARVLGRRSDAAMAEIADEAGVGRADPDHPASTRHNLRRRRLVDGSITVYGVLRRWAYP